MPEPMYPGKFPGTLFLKLAWEFARVRERSCHAVVAERIVFHGLSSSRRRGPRDEKVMRGVSEPDPKLAGIGQIARGTRTGAERT
ncbi:hypothetical protein KL86PLE_90541 [uncultured Pleomorphomonas sp.]|uniref:Uncharacterized protein n=1 Tax=uncultured Pleomorphomonas sp. TaxID=442121 RepID=A0A212LQ26_9HYPH|nr:hypothetical protein KL86PLE_90541 [uncultured Pleomorphomonas sp.]